MHMDPMIPTLVGSMAGILAVGLIFRKLGQPSVVGYLAAGVILGPEVLGLFQDQRAVAEVGEYGVILLLFFVGMEISVPKLLAIWRVPLMGVACQAAGAFAFMIALGYFQGWAWATIVTMAFILTLNSTAVVMKILQEAGEMDTGVGRKVVAILLFQDVAIIVMMIVIQLMGGGEMDAVELALQGVGLAAIVALFAVLGKHERIHLPFGKLIRSSHETEVFGAMIICFGFAMIFGLLGLSAALGAFMGGIVVGAGEETQWVHKSLEPYKVVFMALFFVSVGMQFDFSLFADNWLDILALLFLVMVFNTAVNSFLLRRFGESPAESVYGGGLLSQIGEFSFLLAAIGVSSGTINQEDYGIILSVIVLSLILTAVWLIPLRRWREARTAREADPSLKTARP